MGKETENLKRVVPSFHKGGVRGGSCNFTKLVVPSFHQGEIRGVIKTIHFSLFTNHYTTNNGY